MFDLIVMVDWSAAASPGPKRPAPDRCWIAWGTQRRRFPPVYCRTRAEACEQLAGLLADAGGRALVGWDFPHGYPAGSGLGGGRDAARLLSGLIEDARDGRNNRFAVAALLNRRMGWPSGPFWGRPASLDLPGLEPVRPAFADQAFGEWRLVDREIRRRGRNIQSVWKLYTVGSVGSQTLLGLPALLDLCERPGLADRSRIWPFETGWGAHLDGIVHAEIWPSLADHTLQPYPIKDARQVAAARDWALDLDREGGLAQAFDRPTGLTDSQSATCLLEEGWILNAPSLTPIDCGGEILAAPRYYDGNVKLRRRPVKAKPG